MIRRFNKALDVAGGYHTIEDIEERCRDGRCQSFQVGDGVIVTEMLAYPNARVMNVVMAAGDMYDVLDAQQQMIEFAKKHGCDKVIMRGRKGWRRILKSYGWDEPTIAMELSLGEKK